MRRADIDFALELARREGWNPGLHDGNLFYRTDPNGFFIGWVKDEPVGCISAVSYPGDFGFIGLYIVVPEHRGNGFGKALWERAIRRLKGHNIGLDGVVQQQANYGKSGFQLAYRNVRFRLADLPGSKSPMELVPLEDIDFGKLLTYDSRFFPAPRERFLRSWIRMPGSRALASFRDGQVNGYGVIRRCHTGFKVGPLFARDGNIAEALLIRLTDHAAGGEPIFLDVPEANPAAMQLVERHRMIKVFETARMYTGFAPSIELDGVFGVTTFELG